MLELQVCTGCTRIKEEKKQVIYKQAEAQIAENLSTLLSTLLSSDLVSKTTLLEKIVASCKKIAKTMQI